MGNAETGRKRIGFSLMVLFLTALLVVFSEVWHPLLHHGSGDAEADGWSESTQCVSLAFCEDFCPVCSGQFQFEEGSSATEIRLPRYSADNTVFRESHYSTLFPWEGRPRSPPQSF